MKWLHIIGGFHAYIYFKKRGKDQEMAFLKLVSKETVTYFNPKYDTRVIVDASPIGLGVILIQK